MPNAFELYACKLRKKCWDAKRFRTTYDSFYFPNDLNIFVMQRFFCSMFGCT